MTIRIERTLVKSAPELWELLDDPELMRRWSAALAGAADPGGIAVTRRDEGRRLAWRTTAPAVALDLWLKGKGFGTAVTIMAATERELTGAMLETLLDELGSPQRRPFART